jgi:peptidoglycan hydrolase-like protein with peptidoglycan-binding domain
MILKVGSKGEDVKKLQAKLGLGADGVFGSGTEAAVKKWQSSNGLTADGIVGAGMSFNGNTMETSIHSRA